jgi:hypothetical protein
LIVPTKKKKNHYIDNVVFFEAMKEYREAYLVSLEKGEPRPRASDYIGNCLLLIAKNYSNNSNFRNYPFREDMIFDGVETCLKYMHNFDPNKSNNPLAYFTRTIHFAFLNKIKKEKKELYVKQKSLQNLYFQGLLVDQNIEGAHDVKIDLDNPYMSELAQSIDNKRAEDKIKKQEKKDALALEKTNVVEEDFVVSANTVDQYYEVNKSE